MATFQYILVPLDFTVKNQRAVELAKSLAEPGKTRISLMHVVETGPHSEDDALQAFYRSLEENAEHNLHKLAKPLRDEGYHVEERVALGRPARKIVDESVAAGADLIVLSSHALGASGGADQPWATVSYQAAIFCRCPVLLVK